ncbi:P63C domain-containing protein [Pantoea sp. PNA 14-12]|uniref:P63C domain-containing protein n=1 Tax=Pantoea TaxID=53335 RepID=UPI00105E43F0|nr:MULTISPECIES: P63C domain-containing protein [Pantoea]TDS72699.1 P63C domain-containing protein [Pantoea sp. PNA 14-12]
MSEEKKKSAGGKARAKNLTPERRSEIARMGAIAKSLPKVTHKGILKIAEVEIPCFVLDDGRRVITGRGLTAAIGMKGRGQGVARITGHRMLTYNENSDLAMAIENPIKFIGGSPKVGVPSDGFEATVLQELCEAILVANDNKILTTPQEERYLAFANMLIRAFARVGIVALVDEVTGYQEIRPRDALQAYLDKIISKELAAWAKKFPDEFYENIYKLRGWPWAGMSKNRFSVVAHYTRDLVYERLGDGILDELEKKSPKNDSGARKNKLHQWLTNDVGNPMLSQHLHSIVMIQRLAIANGYGWNKFVKMVDQVMPKKGGTFELELTDPT